MINFRFCLSICLCLVYVELGVIDKVMEDGFLVYSEESVLYARGGLPPSP